MIGNPISRSRSWVCGPTNVTARGIASFVHHTPHAGCIDVAVDKRNPLARILSCATSLTDNAFLTDIVYQHRGTARRCSRSTGPAMGQQHRRRGGAGQHVSDVSADRRVQTVTVDRAQDPAERGFAGYQIPAGPPVEAGPDPGQDLLAGARGPL